LIRGFLGEEMNYDASQIEGVPPIEEEYVLRRSKLAVDDVKQVLSKYWNLS